METDRRSNVFWLQLDGKKLRIRFFLGVGIDDVATNTNFPYQFEVFTFFSPADLRCA